MISKFYYLPSFFIAVIFMLNVVIDASERLPRKSNSFLSVFHQISPTAACTLTVSGSNTRTLLQVNGSVDDIVLFNLCPIALQIPPNVTLVPASTSQQVLSSDLDIDTDIRVISSTTSNCLNITTLLTFDRMVGKTTFIMSARDPFTNTQSCAAQVNFIIAGFTIFEERQEVMAFALGDTSSMQRMEVTDDQNSAITKLIISGLGNEAAIDYRDNLVENIRAYNVKIQYPDGSDSVTTSSNVIAAGLQDIRTRVTLDSTSPVQLNTSTCTSVQNELKKSLQRELECGMAFSTENQSGATGASFGLRFQPYRDGVMTMVFEWDSFTQGFEDLQDEQYTTFLVLNVSGDPPPVVVDFEPKDPFRRAGDELITIVFDNVENSRLRTLKVSGQEFKEVPGSFRKLDNGLYTAQFRTEPGNGTALEWTLSVENMDGDVKTSAITNTTINETISYITTELSVNDINPPFAREGDTITVFGYFDGFNTSLEQHDILIGSQSISTLGVKVTVSEDGSSISFQLPDRREVGEAFDYNVQVVVNNETTNAATVSYTPVELTLSIDVYGASLHSDNDRYTLGGCDSSSFLAVLPSGVAVPKEFSWELTDMSISNKQNVLTEFPDVTSNEQLLRIPAKIFGSSTGLFQLTVLCTIYDQDLEATVILDKTSPPVIGVELPPIRPRSISVPNVPLRIVASISVPSAGCYGGTGEIQYEWSYGISSSQSFSYLNRSKGEFGDSAVPSKLGREFIIPQRLLDYGNVTVSLRTYMKEDPNIGGIASLIVEIRPSEVVPVIGYGAAYLTHTFVQDLSMTGIRSYLRDRIISQNSPNLDFQWTCFLSTSITDTSQMDECGLQFLPNPTAKSFTISAQGLYRYRTQLLSKGLNGTFFIHYGLQAIYNGLASEEREQTIEIISSNTEMAQLDSIKIVGVNGIEMDWDSIPYFSPVMIIPDGKDVTWTFSVQTRNGSEVLNRPADVLLYPGYYNPFSEEKYQSSPLGIQVGTLAPAQRYEITLNVSSQNIDIAERYVKLFCRTRDKPKLILPELTTVSGDQDTIFTLFATINLDTTHEFQYHFFSVSEEEVEQCLDACSGRASIQIRLPIPGTYRILVRLMDVNGNAVLDKAFFNQNISVSAASDVAGSIDKNISHFVEEMKISHKQGDHGTLHLLSTSLPIITLENENISLQDKTDAFRFALEVLDQMAQNTPLNTAAAQSIIQTASRYVSQSAEVIGTQELLYLLAALVDKAIIRVPLEEALTFRDDILLFYNLSISETVQQLPQSEVKERQLETGDDSNPNFSALLVNFYRLQQKHLTIITRRDIVCGEIVTLKSDVKRVRETVPDTKRTIDERVLFHLSRQSRNTFDILSTYDTFQKPKHSVFTATSLCYPQQRNNLTGAASTFEWCSQAADRAGVVGSNGIVFDPNQKVIVTLFETPDYLSQTGALGKDYKADTVYINSLNMTMEQRSRSFAQVSVPSNFDCFSLRSFIPRLGVTSGKGCLSARGFSVQFQEPSVSITDNSTFPIRNASLLQANMSKDGSSTASLSMSTLGTYGAVGVDCPVSARKPKLELPTEDAEFVYLMFGGAAVAAVGVGVTWAATSSSYASAAGGAAAAAA